MKKGLSILLVAAAIFGFYGSAVNVNDILACKDYWEEAGEKSTADMNKLEDGLNQLKDNEQAYLDGLDQVAEGEKTLAAGEAELAKGEADYAAAPGKLAAGEKKLAAGKAAYAAGQKELAAGQSTLNKAKAIRKQLQDGAKELMDQQKGYPAWKTGYDTAVATAPDNVEALSTNGSLDASLINAKLEQVTAQKESLDSAVSALDGLDQVIAGIEANVPEAYRDAVKMSVPDALAYIANQLDATALLPSGEQTANTWIGVAKTLQQNVIKKVATNAGDPNMAQINSAAAVKALQGEAANGITSLNGLLQLVAGKKQMQDKLLPLLDSVKDNDEFVQKLGGKTAVQMLLGGLKGTDAQFEVAMDQVIAKVPELIDTLNKAIASGEKELAAGKKKLAAGAKELKAGEKTLAQGYADYAAAPGKLEDGRQQLADGRAQLAAGKDQLAQYEDGEQQVRDGLATLVGTEADLDLESILDRLNGDSDFDNGDNHLELDEGLAAVEVGRGYQAEDGVLITKEIMTRAIGTGGLLAAGVLAVLAAILSFTKKNKGAGVCAILAAAAGAFGAYEATQAGSYFSSIAGSTVGQTGMIAAGILGCVALVHAIVHFTAKKEA